MFVTGISEAFSGPRWLWLKWLTAAMDYDSYVMKNGRVNIVAAIDAVL